MAVSPHLPPGKGGCNGRLEAATTADSLHLFGQGNFFFIRKKSGKCKGILKEK